ncbi:putative ribonuclease H-like domain-containing protein [Tanacetum coccineum]
MLQIADPPYSQDPKSSHDDVSKPSSDDGKKIYHLGSTKKGSYALHLKLMHEKFQMSSIGELTFFLGLQVKQKKDGIFISQDKYVAEILKKFGFTKVKTASTPMETQKPLLKDEDGKQRKVLDDGGKCCLNGLELMLGNLKVNAAMHKAVHKELGDSLVRAATTASSLEAEQDSESSVNEESLGEDASKQERIDAIDADEEITLDKDKGILIELVKPMNKKDLIRLNEETTLNLQAEFDEEERLARKKAEKKKKLILP